MNAEPELTGPGAPFELWHQLVLGERMVVFRDRAPHLRALLEHSARFGSAEYLVFDELRLNYRDHLKRVASVARALEERFGVRKGDRVAILAANCPEWIVTFWAALSLGALPVGLNAWWAGDEIRFALDDCRPKVLIADEKRLARLGGNLPQVAIVGVEDDFGALYDWDREAALPSTPLAEDDPAAILYTSGTTGRPKGVVHTHRNVIALVQLQLLHGARMAKLLGRAAAPAAKPAQRCMLVSNPLFHVSGLYTQVVTSLAVGAKTVWTRGRFDAGRVLELIARERVTSWSPHGAMGPRVLRHPDVGKWDLSSVVNLGTGGAPVPPSLQAGLRAIFPNAANAMTVGYGLTEGTALACLAYGADLEAHPESVGRPLATIELELRGDDGRPVAPGDEGEIHLRSPLVMKEYFRRPEETAAAICRNRWLRTGDVGRMIEGRLYVSARRRDLILRGAENVSPLEIERRLEAHPSVKEAAVIGVPHPELGQEVKAFVVASDGAEPRPQELAAWVAETLAYYKVPSRWEVRSAALPRNASGKLLRQVLADGGGSPFIEE
ncbi:MAG TPA: class I adenylate-forming enzyme family protein [Polyangia bacterium]|nr:class I adenylate-forming enzyme family protein [Polyangia bacterium]